jgi:hypothetical protein
MIEKKKKRRWARRVLISLVLTAAGCVSLFFSLPSLLIAPSGEAKSDVILYCAASSHSDDKYVIDLYRRGFGRKIVCVSSQVSRELYPSDYMRESLISRGAPAEDVISLRLPLSPCGGVALTRIAEFVRANGWKSALYVSYPEESRYMSGLARKFFERDGLSVAVAYSPEDRYELTRNWSRTHWKAQRIFAEALTITLDRFYSECR